MTTKSRKYDDNQLRGFYDYHRTKECPSCRALQARVKESRRVPEGVRRRYTCSSCDYKYTTYEVDAGAYEELRSLRSKFLQLQQIVGEVNPPLQQVVVEPVADELASPEHDSIPCCDCVHATPYGCSFDIPEAQTEDARGCNLFQAIISDSILT